jgi:protein phosphatase
MFNVASLTDTGLKRKRNEDNILVDENIFLVSDGMGGHKAGDIASKIVVNSMKRVKYNNIEIDDSYYDYVINLLNSAVENAHNDIVRYAKKSKIDTIMGATIAGVYKNLLIEDKLAIFHIGDSRVYRVRDKRIERLTTDHSQYEDMRKSGKFTSKELSGMARNTITKAIGNFQFYKLEIKFAQYMEEDRYIICSDGVSDLCSDKDLEEIVNRNISLDKTCQDIKELVYNRGAKDNLSIIAIHIKSNSDLK